MANYEVETQDDLAKWWPINDGSGSRMSDMMDDCPDGPAIYHRDADDDWTADGAPEYYVATATKPDNVSENLAGWRNMTDAGDDQNGSLAQDEWSYDTGNNRVYIRLSDDSDPDDTDVRCDYDWDGAGAGPAIMTERAVDTSYEVHLDLEVGDGSTSTTLNLTGEAIVFDSNAGFHITSGATVNADRALISLNVNSSTYQDVIASGQSSAAFNINNSIFLQRGSTGLRFRDGDIVAEDTTFSFLSKTSAFNFSAGVTYTLNRCFFKDVTSFDAVNIPTVQNSFLLDTCNTAVTYGGSSTLTVEGLDYSNYSVRVLWSTRSGSGNTIHLINPSSVPTQSEVRLDHADSVAKVSYPVNIHISDKDHVPLQNATVACEYGHVVLGTDTQAYRCIKDHTAGNDDERPVTGANWEEYWKIVYGSGAGGSTPPVSP